MKQNQSLEPRKDERTRDPRRHIPAQTSHQHLDNSKLLPSTRSESCHDATIHMHLDPTNSRRMIMYKRLSAKISHGTGPNCRLDVHVSMLCIQLRAYGAR